VASLARINESASKPLFAARVVNPPRLSTVVRSARIRGSSSAITNIRSWPIRQLTGSTLRSSIVCSQDALVPKTQGAVRVGVCPPGGVLPSIDVREWTKSAARSRIAYAFPADHLHSAWR
jgi:hypothetical protein